MKESKNERPIDLLMAANKGKIKNIRIDLPPFEAFMGIDDVFLITEERDKIKRVKYAEYEVEGLHKLPINEKDWEKEFKDSLDRQREAAKEAGIKFDEKETIKNIEADKPDNLAEQLASRIANSQAIIEIIPKIVKKEDGFTAMFPTREEQQIFKKLIKSDLEMFTYLAGKCTEAILLWTKKKDVEKNSLPELSSGNVENGKSKSDVPDDGDTTDPLIQD